MRSKASTTSHYGKNIEAPTHQRNLYGKVMVDPGGRGGGVRPPKIHLPSNKKEASMLFLCLSDELA